MSSYKKCFFYPQNDKQAFEEKRIRIYCFSHAGGGPSVINSLLKFTPNNIEVIGIQLSGRENRFLEPLNNDLFSVIEEVSGSIDKESEEKAIPFFLLGQCSGAILAYETALKLEKNKNLKGLIICSRPSPNYSIDEIDLKLNNDAFLQEIKKIGGFNAEILNEPAMVEFLLPTIRNDFSMVSGYTRSFEKKVNIPLLVLRGKQDKVVSNELISTWTKYTNSQTTITDINGGHFLFEESPKDLMSQVKIFVNKVKE